LIFESEMIGTPVIATATISLLVHCRRHRRNAMQITTHSPFEGRAQFDFAEILFTQEEMAQSRVDRFAQLLAALYPDKDPPFADHKDLYATIDVIQQGDVPWQSFSIQYTRPLPDGVAPEWMTQKYEVWFRSPLEIFEKQLVNPDFKDEIDWAPKRIFKNGKRQLEGPDHSRRDVCSKYFGERQDDCLCRDRQHRILPVIWRSRESVQFDPTHPS
jgi:hypothetical protein